MNTAILLISDRNESVWSEMLYEVLSNLGSLNVVSIKEAHAKVLQTPSDLIIIDADAIEKPAQLVSFLRSQAPDVQVAVTTTTPTWQEARAVLRAGAVDYFRQALNKEELVSTIQDILSRLPDAQID